MIPEISCSLVFVLFRWRKNRAGFVRHDSYLIWDGFLWHNICVLDIFLLFEALAVGDC